MSVCVCVCVCWNVCVYVCAHARESRCLRACEHICVLRLLSLCLPVSIISASRGGSVVVSRIRMQYFWFRVWGLGFQAKVSGIRYAVYDLKLKI